MSINEIIGEIPEKYYKAAFKEIPKILGIAKSTLYEYLRDEKSIWDLSARQLFELITFLGENHSDIVGKFQPNAKPYHCYPNKDEAILAKKHGLSKPKTPISNEK